jgi:hypothetical protein
MLDMLRGAGFFGYLVVGLGGLALPAAFVAAWVGLQRLSPRQRLFLGVGCLAAALLIFALGVVGYLTGMSQMGAALVHAAPADVAALKAAGASEAEHNLTLGVLSAAAPCLAGLLLVMKGSLRKSA